MALYLILVAAATALVAISTQVTLPKWHTLVKLVEWIDTVGVPAYAVVGMQLAQAQGLSTPGVVLVGVLNGVGGGVLRDVLANEPAHLLLPGQYTTLVLLLACVMFVVLTRWSGMAATPAGLAAMALFFVIRALTIRFNWQTQGVGERIATLIAGQLASLRCDSRGRRRGPPSPAGSWPRSTARCRGGR